MLFRGCLRAFPESSEYMEKKTWNHKEWEVSTRQLMKSHGYAAKEDYRKETENARLAEELAGDIMKLSQNTLLINLRFLEAAFVKLVPGHDLDTLSMATDGTFLYYNSVHVCRQFRRAKELVVRDYLHVVLHCVFRHLFISGKVDGSVWDLACDIAVENLIGRLDLRCLACERQAAQGWLLKKLEEELPRLSAEWIYKYFMEQDLSREELERIRENFYADDHSIWHKETVREQGNGDQEKPDSESPEKTDAGKDPDVRQNAEEETEPEKEDGEKSRSVEGLMALAESKDGGGIGGEGNRKDDRAGKKPALKPEPASEKEWKKIAERIQVDLETFSDSYGEGTGSMTQLLREINQEKYDYTKLLRKFSVLGENVEINDEEFDYIFYTYGLKLYKEMPLVEPLEYKDVKKIREFVIAIDTSESVSGEIVQKFIEKTWNLLKQSENFFRKINVHIIQCGARVEEDVRITSEEEFDQYIRQMVLKGFGGTDFRPVFEHVSRLLRQHEFTNLKGLIYFTDGFGTFPTSPPPFDAAFVFLDQGYELPQVPPWAMKVLLKEDEIRMM